MLFGKGKGEDPLALLQEGKFKEAAKALEARLKKSPNDFSVKMRLAEAYEGDGRKEQAAVIYREEAEASLSGGDRSQALALFKKALRLLPGDEALATRIENLEGQQGNSTSQSFSFDVDMFSTPSQAEPSPSEGEGAASDTDVGLAKEDVVPLGGEPQVESEALSTEPLLEAAELLAEPPPAEVVEVLAKPAVEQEEKEETNLAPDGRGSRELFSRLFPELDPAHIGLLASASRPVSLAAGQVLVQEEAPGDSLFVVVSGHLEARGHFEGRSLLLGTFGPGDIIGEVAFLNKVPRTATVTAVEPSKILELASDVTGPQFAQFPDMQIVLESILYQRVERTLQLVKQVNRDSDGHP